MNTTRPVIDLLAVQGGGDVRIPGSNLPVRQVTLHGEATLVRYPPGWARPQHGHYLAGEEFVVLAGELHVSGVTYLPGHHAWVPAGALRHGSAAPGGALVLTCFAGPATWVPSELDEPDGPSLRTPLATAVIPPGGLRLTARSMLCDQPARLVHEAELVTVGSWTWRRSDLMPEGRVLVRWS